MIFTTVGTNKSIFSGHPRDISTTVGKRNSVKIVVVFLVLLSILMTTAVAQEAASCVAPKAWVLPSNGNTIQKDAVMKDVLQHRLIMLGEHHQNAEHHKWHLDMLRDVARHTTNLELAIEMLPRSAQGVLDRWAAGELTEAEFIKKSNWENYWFYDVELYMPVLRFAKDKGIKIHAVNVERSLLNLISDVGWDNVPREKREGLSKPVVGTKPYLIQLAKSFRRHQPMTMDHSKHNQSLKKEEGDKFARFVEVQMLWDRAMAEGINSALKQPHQPVVVSIMGSGHMMNGNGAIHQLASINDLVPMTLIPWDAHLGCSDLAPGYAKYVYGGQLLEH